jgi:hypothetical protein
MGNEIPGISGIRDLRRPTAAAAGTVRRPFVSPVPAGMRVFPQPIAKCIESPNTDCSGQVAPKNIACSGSGCIFQNAERMETKK